MTVAPDPAPDEIAEAVSAPRAKFAPDLIVMLPPAVLMAPVSTSADVREPPTNDPAGTDAFDLLATTLVVVFGVAEYIPTAPVPLAPPVTPIVADDACTEGLGPSATIVIVPLLPLPLPPAVIDAGVCTIPPLVPLKATMFMAPPEPPTIEVPAFTEPAVLNPIDPPPVLPPVIVTVDES